MNKQTLLILLLGTFIMTSFAITIAVIVVLAKKRQAKERLERQRLAFAYDNELLRARLHEQEQAMQIISGELHDNLSQILGHTRMYLFQVLDYITAEEGKRHVHRISDLLKRVLDEVRHISHGLDGELLSRIGLEASIEREITFLREATNIKAQFEIEGIPVKLRTDQNLLLFRIIQECLQNIIKHSRATEISIMLYYHSSTLRIELKDNGVGFEVGKAEDFQSIGLKNIQNRTRLLDAELKILSVPGAGTTTCLKVPYPVKSKYSN